MIIFMKIFKIFKSLKLALFLISYIITTSLIASLIPQGLTEEFYYSKFNFFLAKLILFFKFNNFFYSFLFFIPAIIFFINITSCSIYRIYHRKKNNLKKKYGPDLIHIGIILLLLSGLYSLFNRQENVIYLNIGEKNNLRNGYQIILNDFTIETYSTGIIKDWISEVEIRRYGNLIKNYKIEVNKPCTFGQYKVYQYSYRKLLNVTLQDDIGKEFVLTQGSVLEGEDKNYILVDIVEQNNSKRMDAIFNEYNGTIKSNNQIKVTENNKIGRYTVISVQAYFVTGLNIVEDNSYRIVFLAIFVMILGLIMTYYKDANKGEIK